MWLVARTIRRFGFAATYSLAVIVVLVVSALLEQSLNPGPVFVFLTILLGNILVCALALYVRRKTSERWIKEEAERWLLARANRLDARLPPWPRRLFRRMLWAPSVLVFAVFLFFPETFGIASHLLHGRSIYIAPYRLRAPLTWMIGDKTGSYLWVVAAKGMARTGLVLYWDQPISSVVVYPVASSSREEIRISTPPATAKVLSKRAVSFPQGRFTCWDIIPFAYTRPDVPSPNSAEIECSTSNNDLFAIYDGPRFNSAAFYQILQTIERDD